MWQFRISDVLHPRPPRIDGGEDLVFGGLIYINRLSSPSIPRSLIDRTSSNAQSLHAACPWAFWREGAVSPERPVAQATEASEEGRELEEEKGFLRRPRCRSQEEEPPYRSRVASPRPPTNMRRSRGGDCESVKRVWNVGMLVLGSWLWVGLFRERTGYAADAGVRRAGAWGLS